jgi:uncharacterized lipoprotein YbaY
LPHSPSLPDAARWTSRPRETNVLGSQTVTNPGTAPVPFRVEYHAEDALLRLGLNIEVRVSYGGKVQYYNRNHYAVSLGSVSDTHRISVDRSGS